MDDSRNNNLTALAIEFNPLIMDKIPADLSSKILTIGPDYKNHRGGVGAVIEVYSRYYEVFNFIASHRPGSAFFRVSLFLKALGKLILTLISDRKIKIIHIHGASFGSFYRKFILFLICKYIFRKKIIYHIHGGGFNLFYEKSDYFSKKLIRMLFSKADIVICISQSWMEYYQHTFRIKKLVLLSNVIDYPEKPSELKKQNELTFLFLGLVCKPKGIYDLIEVIRRNKSSYRGRMKLWIGGNGEIDHLKDIILKYDLGELVEFLGWITSTKKAEVLNNSDVFILPSYYEGVPISILEAMSYGKAIIATNVGGVSEIVTDRENGLLIKPGDLEQIEKSLNYFLENRDLVKVYGKASAQIVQRHLPDKVIFEVEKIYKSVLE